MSLISGKDKLVISSGRRTDHIHNENSFGQICSSNSSEIKTILVSSTSTSKGGKTTSTKRKKKIIDDNLETIDSEVVIQSILYHKIERDDKNKKDKIEVASLPNEKVLFTTPVDSLSQASENDSAFSENRSTNEQDIPMITVVLETMSKEKMEMNFRIDSEIEEVKERLRLLFNINPEFIDIRLRGRSCSNRLPLSELGEPPSVIKLDIFSTKPTEYLCPGQFDRYSHFTKKIIVKIPKDEGGFKEIPVEIENQSYFKIYYGGYRNKITDVKYYNQLIQTLPRKRKPGLQLYTRETQTPVFPLKEFTTDTSNDKATQMWRSDHYIPNDKDRIIIGNSERFTSDDEKHNVYKIALRVSKIQKFFRRISEARTERRSLAIIDLYIHNEEAYRKAITDAKIIANRRQVISTTFPNNRDDFYLLYLLLGKWWRKEINKIKKMKHNEARKAAVFDLLEQEVEFLYVIDKKRTEAKKEILGKQEMAFLETTARPIIFRNNKGTMSSIDNVKTQQAREYQEIMSAFLKKDVSVEKRIDVLQNLKYLIMNYDCFENSAEIMELLDQECDLLTLGMNEKEIEGLRKRTLQLLQFYLHEYKINPNSKKYLKPNYPKTDRTLYQCKYCKRIKRASEFNVHVRMTKFDVCHSCQWLKNIGHERMDLTPYTRILEQVRESEMKKCCYSSFCYVLQMVGMSYLVKKIWNDESVISENNNLDELCMVRFRKNEDWSPWNCILLTLEESDAHENFSSVESVYDQWLLDKIHKKHMRARNEFIPVLLNDQFWSDSGIWFNVQDSGKFLHPSHIRHFATSGEFAFLSKKNVKF